jgi:pyridoxamine 5'-phosphate oxidase
LAQNRPFGPLQIELEQSGSPRVALSKQQRLAYHYTMSLNDLATLTASLGFADRNDPFKLFAEWLDDAKKSEVNDPDAMALSTVDDEGLPNVRMVLMKEFDERGFVFYTNLESQKGHEILSTGKAASVFHWKTLRRQVRVRGLTERVSDAQADAYFKSRPRDSKIGAWASQQSRPLTARFELETAVAVNTARFGITDVPRPPHWSGIRIKPLSLEFWHDRPFRLHDRVVFRRENPDGAWSKARLYP